MWGFNQWMKLPASMYMLAILLCCLGCQTQEIKLFELEEVYVPHSSYTKSDLKGDLAFITIAYSDLFGREISGDMLNALTQAYNSVGDKDVIIDRIIRNFLNMPGVQIPSDEEMRQAPEAFVRQLYRHLLTREPDETELWYLSRLIESEPKLQARDLYYALLTSEEYRYY